MKRIILLGAFGLSSLGLAAPAAAHSQIVTPPGADEPVVSGPIARPWVQAHCHAAAPAVVSDASGGVVAFPPGTALPCPDDVRNPGGQVTGP
jgi:hypothetical protein